ncbi:MAG: FRG domain-containing protein [Caldilineaceae bacterium]|nr:FRG domain-containing protein [Caldilineaceae bacterium]
MNRIRSVEEFIGWTEDLQGEMMLYRGLAKADWDVSSSAYRRIERSENEPSLTIDSMLHGYTVELLNDASLRGFRERQNKNLSDLEMLAELQHYGAATCLIDFSENAMIALWFACYECPGHDGKVFAVETGDATDFFTVSYEDINKPIESFLDQGKLWKWKPNSINNRIFAQQSTFLFGMGRIEEWCVDYKEIKIEADRKENIRDALKKSFGIGEQSLFNDLDGFARCNSHNRPYLLTTERLHLLGKSFHQQANFKRAIECYERTTKYNPRFYKAYHDCRVARTQLLLRELEYSWNHSLKEYNELWNKLAIKLQHSFMDEQLGCVKYIDGGLTLEQKEEQEKLKNELRAYLEREHEGAWGKLEDVLGEDLKEDRMNSWEDIRKEFD